MTADPYAAYLQQADALFAAGDVVKAGQIWQAILKREPGHAHAREGLLKVREILARQQAAPAAPPPPPPAPEVDVEAWVRQGCTLYDMGQIEEALHKWEEVLAVAPDHPIAGSYAKGARKELGLSEGARPAQAPAPMAPPAAPVPIAVVAPDVEILLREAAQLYDLGVMEEAMAKWTQVLQMAPDNEQARSFLQLAEKEEAENRRRWTAATTATPHVQRAEPAPEPLANATIALPTQAPGIDPRLTQARHLLETGHLDEAAAAFRLVLADQPGHPEAREGLAQIEPLSAPPPPPQEARAVALPAKVTGPSAPRRSGVSLPTQVQGFKIPDWVQTPQFLAATVGGLILVGLGINIWRGIQRDRQLESDVLAAKRAAQGPVARATAITDLSESIPAILSEGQQALKDAPLIAYHRAREVLRRSPGDGAAAQLLERARLALVPLGTAPPNKEALEIALRGGDLAQASRLLDGLLRADPDNPELMRRAARIFSQLAQTHALQRHWSEARECLRQGRALFPGDSVWQARLRLLDRIEAQPKAEQPGWIALL